MSWEYRLLIWCLVLCSAAQAAISYRYDLRLKVIEAALGVDGEMLTTDNRSDLK